MYFILLIAWSLGKGRTVKWLFLALVLSSLHSLQVMFGYYIPV